MAIDPITLSAIGSAVSASTPFLTRALGGLFGVKSAEDEQRERIEQSMAPYARIAQGGTTQGQAGLAYARGRAAQELAGQAARGTAQQQAGLQREAMRVAQDTGAQYAAQLAELRAREQERAMMGVAAGQRALSALAGEEAQRKRQELAGAISGTLGGLAKVFLPSGPADAAATEAARQEEARKLLGEDYAKIPGSGVSSTEAAEALGFTQAPAASAARAAAGGAAAVAPAAQAPAAAQSGYESLYTGPSIQTAPTANQQRIEADAAMTYMAMRDPSKTAMAREYFAQGPSPEAAAATNERLRAERTLATANVTPGPVAPGQKDYTAGMSGNQGTFATLADRAEANAAVSPFMKSPAEQGASASLAPTKMPTAFSYQGEQTEGLRKARPGRMPRRPGQVVRGGGGLGL